MGAFFTSRILRSIPTVFGITLIAFFLIRLIPGDPVLLMIGERDASPEVMESMRAQLGLDKSLLTQYGLFIGHALKGDLGQSVISNRSVTEEFRDRFPATMELAILSLISAVVIGIPLGVVAAINRGRWLDRVSMTISLFGYSMPIFWWGLVLILIFSVHLGWLPVSGRLSPELDVEPWSGFMTIDVVRRGLGLAGFWDAIKHLILPSVVLGTVPLGAIARMTRSSFLEVLGEDYIRTAKSKGLTPSRINMVHALKNALVPIVTIIGLMLGSLLTGAVLTETLFSWPGVGRWLVSSVSARDYPVLQGGILLISLFVIFVNILVDTLYVGLDPRLQGFR